MSFMWFDHVPEKTRRSKDRLAAWDNPVMNWPPRMPRPTMHSGKTLLNHCDRTLKQKIEGERPFRIPNYRTGDVLEVSMFNSLSERKFNVYKGLVIG